MVAILFGPQWLLCKRAIICQNWIGISPVPLKHAIMLQNWTGIGPMRDAIMHQNWTRIGPMLLALAQFRSSSGALWHVSRVHHGSSCCSHWPNSDPVLVRYGMFPGFIMAVHAARIGPIPVQFWCIMACFQGSLWQFMLLALAQFRSSSGALWHVSRVHYGSSWCLRSYSFHVL